MSEEQKPETRAYEPVFIQLTEGEVNFITGRLVRLPYQDVAPVIQVLGTKLSEARSVRNR